MTRRDDDDRALREFFAAVHAGDRVPPFERLARRRSARRPALAWRPAVAVAAVALAAIAAGWLLPRVTVTGTVAAALSEEQQLALARELSSPASWRGPLDFLLETPSREILSAPPSFELTTLTLPSPPAGEEEKQP